MTLIERPIRRTAPPEIADSAIRSTPAGNAPEPAPAKVRPLICYTIPGAVDHYGPHDVPNKDYLAEIYVCGHDLREMAALIARHLPAHAKIKACDFGRNGTRGWPSNMKWVSPTPGVWCAKHHHSVMVYAADHGTLTEID